MPPKGKKKKPAANPARGFATTSIASKPKPEQGIDTPSTTPGTGNATPVKSSDTPASTVTNSTSTEPGAPSERPLHELSPDELEKRLDEGELQSIVDRFSSKSQRDASRQVAKMQTDCRLLRASATSVSWRGLWAESLIAEIVALAQADVNTGRLDAANEPGRLHFREEDMIVRLWTLRRALLMLGFSSDSVVAATKQILCFPPEWESSSLVWGLDQSLDWLVLNSPESELPTFSSATGKVNDMRIDPSLQFTMKQNEAESQGESIEADQKATDKSSNEQQDQQASQGEDFAVSDVESDLEPDEILSKWLDTKAKLYEKRPDLFEASKSKAKKKISGSVSQHTLTPGVQKLQQNLAKIESDVLFDQYAAEASWIERRNEIAQSLADQRRADLTRTEPPPGKQRSRDSSPSPEPPMTSIDITHDDTKDADEDEELIGGIFGESVEQAELEAARMSESAAADTTNVRLRSMPHWKGISPRRILHEACRARDSSCVLSYKLISLSSWSNRHSLMISWSKPQNIVVSLDAADIKTIVRPKHLQFSMTKIACSTEQDSEAFISTFAMFQIFSISPKEDNASLRLPQVWRDVYRDFVDQGKEQADRRDRQAVREIRHLVREQAQLDEDEDVIHTKSFEARHLERSRNHTDDKESDTGGSTAQDLQTMLQGIWTEKSSTPSYKKMLQARERLPMAQFKSQCLDTITNNQVTILCGETGCGKSTQMPAFILEHELCQGRQCKIYCTEPRRISAITLAQRVSQEMGEPKSACGTSRSLVGYAIRLESNLTNTTRLVFATTGIVLRMLESKDGFSEVTHIVVDEVHERSIETDFLLIILRRLLKTRPALKVILMSATVDSKRFSDYFNGAPVLNVPGRTFPVETRYLEDAIELTGHKLEGDDDQSQDREDDLSDDISGQENAATKDSYVKSYSKATRTTLAKYNEYRIDYTLIANLISSISSDAMHSNTGYGRAILVFLPGLAEIRQMNDMLLSSEIGKTYDIHQLHSTIASEDQQLAFEIPVPGRGKIVLSTNIAETGVTIPDITCVIDTGKHKEMRFDERRQVSRLLETFISRANAKQRRGRAGRVQEGLCFHLFTKYRHDALIAPQQTPEMLRLSLQDLIMRVKITRLGDIQSALSSALDAPAPKNVRRAIDALVEVGALTSAEELTPLGRQLSKLPLDPYLGKLVLYGAVYKCLEVTLTIAAILTSKSPFVTPIGARKQADLARTAFKKADSDLITDYNAYVAWKRVCTESSTSEYQFCRKNMLSFQTLSNIEDLKGQLFSALRDTGLLSGVPADERLTQDQGSRRVRKFVQVPSYLSRFSSMTSPLLGGIIAWALYPKILARDPSVKHSFRSIASNQSIAFHPTSILRLSPPASPAVTAFVSYYSVIQSSGGAKNYNASGITPVHPLLLLLGPAGEARFDGIAGAVILDGARLRLLIGEGTPAGWRVLTAIKFLRARVEECLRKRWNAKGSADAALGAKLARWWAVWEKCVEAWELEAKTREARRLD